jgi:CelD/BcsL family acetyltransferase involved in cellulose biosynthesis
MTASHATGGAAIAGPLPAGTARHAGAHAVLADVVGSFDAGITAAAWNGLLERCAGTVYSTHEWQSAWWEFFGRGRELHLIRFRSGDELVGIAPLFSERGGGSPGRRLRLVGSGDAFTKSGGILADDGPGDYLDFLVDPAHAEGIARALEEHLRRRRGEIGRIDLVNLREDGAFMRHILPRLEGGTFAPRVREGERCPFIEIGPDAPSFIRSLDGGARRRYAQAFRLVESPEPPLRRVDNDPASLGRVFADMVRLHQERWNRAGYPGLFFSDRSLRFQETVAERFSARGWLWHASLYDGDRCVAARLGFTFGDRMYDYLSGFDESSQAARRRPGLGLLVAMYGEAAARGLRTLDLLRGAEAYKFELTGRAARIYNATIAVAHPPGPVGKALGAVASAVEFGGFMAGREFRLYRVQARRHGLLRSAGKYLGFRTSRIRNRMKSGSAGNAPRDTKGDPAS